MIHNGQIIAKKFFSFKNSKSYDHIVKYTTFGKDSLWKKNMIKHIDNEQKCILDLACGTGILSSYIPSNKLTIGADLTYDYILNSKYKKNYSLLINSIAEELPFRSDIFDVIIASYLAKYTDILHLVSEIWRILKKKGLVIIHDFTYPDEKLFQVLWHYYFSLLKKVGKIIKSWEIVFSDLDKIIKNSKWTENLITALKTKGFVSVECKYYTWKTSAIILARKI